MYRFYLDKTLLPVAPSEMTMKINNKNETMQMINEGEINLLKSAGLTDVEFEALIPQQNYPFAQYLNGNFVRASIFLDTFERLKVSEEPFQLVVTRTAPDNRQFFHTNLKVSMEEYTIKESRGEGTDLLVNIKLKQYKEFGTKTAKIKFAQSKPKVNVSKNRSQESSPAPKKKSKTHTVKRGDTLWAICKKYYGKANWNLVNKITAVNKQIKNPNLIYPGQKFTIPPL